MKQIPTFAPAVAVAPPEGGSACRRNPHHSMSTTTNRTIIPLVGLYLIRFPGFHRNNWKSRLGPSRQVVPQENMPNLDQAYGNHDHDANNLSPKEAAPVGFALEVVLHFENKIVWRGRSWVCAMPVPLLRVIAKLCGSLLDFAVIGQIDCVPIHAFLTGNSELCSLQGGTIIVFFLARVGKKDAGEIAGVEVLCCQNLIVVLMPASDSVVVDTLASSFSPNACVVHGYPRVDLRARHPLYTQAKGAPPIADILI
mmetsp:Transcript_54186/g.87720  ORF Transcript_54186/g.87720 Transcript_54186/m.87720 type:complete len:254 (+) Transcript_54186:2772-3533(+)